MYLRDLRIEPNLKWRNRRADDVGARDVALPPSSRMYRVVIVTSLWVDGFQISGGHARFFRQ